MEQSESENTSMHHGAMPLLAAVCLSLLYSHASREDMRFVQKMYVVEVCYAVACHGCSVAALAR
jgi:hypothetical protein